MEKIWYQRVIVEDREKGEKSAHNLQPKKHWWGLWRTFWSAQIAHFYIYHKQNAERQNHQLWGQIIKGEYFHHHRRPCCHQIIRARRNAVVALEWCVLCPGGGDLISQQSCSRCAQQCKYCTMHNAHCTMHTAHCRLLYCTMNYTLQYTVQCSLKYIGNICVAELSLRCFSGIWRAELVVQEQNIFQNMPAFAICI